MCCVFLTSVLKHVKHKFGGRKCLILGFKSLFFCQVKIFEEDFQRERSDRERMNEEKEELKKQLEKLQKQLTLTNNQVGNQKNHSEFGSSGDLNLISSMEFLEGGF